MLALSRKTNESIIIGNEIEITILEIKGDQVKVGIKAPKSVPVYREEVYKMIQDSNKEAATDAVQENLKNLFKQRDALKKGKYCKNYEKGVKSNQTVADIAIEGDTMRIWCPQDEISHGGGDYGN